MHCTDQYTIPQLIRITALRTTCPDELLHSLIVLRVLIGLLVAILNYLALGMPVENSDYSHIMPVKF